MPGQDDIRVFYSSRDTVCDDCNGSIERGELIAFSDARETLCLSCADLDHLIFLPAGNAALTRRSKEGGNKKTPQQCNGLILFDIY